MVKTNQCVKEWKATIEALGQGKQSIFLRVYPTNKNGFLLYPTTNYAIKDDYLQGFKTNHHEFVESNSKSGSGIEIKYYADCVDVMQVSLNKISKLDKFYIWTKDHVKSYINNRKAYVWLLRVYELENPEMVTMATGQIYAKVNKNIDLTNMKPVLSDEKFNETVEKIKKVV
jgi:hypothetical protein